MTPKDFLVAFVVWLVMVGVAFAAGAFAVRRPTGVDRAEPSGGESDTTVEIPSPAPRRRRPPKTGTVHEPRRPVVPADDATVVIRMPDEVPR